MLRNLLYILLVFTVISSCSDDPTRIKNRKMIERDKFINILIDIHLMDAITNSPEYFRKYSNSDSLDLYANIFDKYHVTKAEFDSTVSSYTRQPELFIEVYDEVLLKLHMRLHEMKDQPADADSTRNVDPVDPEQIKRNLQ